jgi:RNA polymerase sigma-70 factor (ECF subfamily)
MFTVASTGEIESTAKVINQLRSGDKDAFAKIYDNHASVVYGVICRMVRDAAVAEDLLQEVFFKLWRSADRLDNNVTSLTPWLLTVARRQALDYSDRAATRGQ